KEPLNQHNAPAQSGDTADLCILLGLFNGEAHLQEQLDSYLAQTHDTWLLIASDDGSSDASVSIFNRFKAGHPDRHILLQKGPRKGFVRNFQNLISNTPPHARYAALSDQDDVWFPDKLERAVTLLDKVPPTCPAIYCAATLICDDALRPLGKSARFRRNPDFRNSLVQSIGGGNTMVLNRAAIDLATSAAADGPSHVAHDWWLYQLITGCGGKVLRDPEPVLRYRQHHNNLIGANVTVRGRLIRLFAVMGGRFRRWNETSLAAIEPSSHRFTPQARATLAHYQAARHGTALTRLRNLRASGVYRQSSIGTLALYFACALGRL
ncbi:MAG: glycosyltransferase family 2 protein, partial [Roseovarius sp.]|nr:glycosyltransferase family 2 protein [Roseovarius sp.]